MKYLKHISKWLVAASVLMSAPVFTSCDDDDDPLPPVPTEFTLDLNSLNIAWNETEGVVEVGANSEWQAVSETSWITIDPSRGEPGDYRMFLNFEPNPYRLPRTGELTVTCGEQTGRITVTQGGCSDDSKVAPCEASLEIQSLDYETGEVKFSAFAAAIEGNLGMTMEQFASGVDDEGTLDFFMVGKDGQWIEGGTAGTRCGAWLDANMSVAPWNADGYPANAAFVEVYGGEDPTLVIGRAPGVPDDAEYTINFGLTVRDDHSKYCLFTVKVKFTAVDLVGELVGTIDLDVIAPPYDNYTVTYVPFDEAAVRDLLGCSSMSLVKVVGYDANGEFVPYTADNGYWFNLDGSIGSWGEGAGWYLEYHGDSDEATDVERTSWNFGNFPGVTRAQGQSQIGFWYNAKVVMFNVNVTIEEMVY